MVEALRFDAIAKAFGGLPVLRDVELTVAPDEYFALVGVNGAGKSTLLKSMLDFCHLDSGRIGIFGLSHRDAAARACIAYLPERFVPHYFLNGREFLCTMAELHGIRYKRNEVEAVFAHLDLDSGAFDMPVRNYSKGMAQKLGLAACLLSQRALLVLDEPMSGLDPKARALLKSWLLERKSSGQTLFFTTHLLNDVEALCDRLGILHEGRVVFVGTPAECCDRFDRPDLEQAYLAAIGAASPRA